MQDIDDLCARIEADVQELLLSGDPNADPPPDEEPDPGVGLAHRKFGLAPVMKLPGGFAGGPSVPRSEVNSELNFPPNFEGLVLGCIDADFCK